MYNGIGLQTPRGSGTNGYVQTNKFFVRPKTNKPGMDNKGFAPDQGTAGVSKKPNKDILEHHRKRQIELKLTILEDTLTDQGYTDAEIAEKVSERRRALEAAESAANSEGSAGGVSSEKLSDTQTHQIAARKEKQMETLRTALGIAAPSAPEQKEQGMNDGGNEREEDDEYEDGELLQATDGKDELEKQMEGVDLMKNEGKTVRSNKMRQTEELHRKEHESKRKRHRSSYDDSSESEDKSDSGSDSDETSSKSDDSDVDYRSRGKKRPGGHSSEKRGRNHKHVAKRRRDCGSSDSGGERKRTKDIDSASDTDSDGDQKKSHKPLKSTMHKAGDHGSVDSDSHRGRGDGRSTKIHKRHDSESDSDYNSRSPIRKNKKVPARSGRDDFDNRTKNRGGFVDEGVKHPKTSKAGADANGESDSDRGAKFKRFRADERKRTKRHDSSSSSSDDDESDSEEIARGGKKRNHHFDASDPQMKPSKERKKVEDSLSHDRYRADVYDVIDRSRGSFKDEVPKAVSYQEHRGHNYQRHENKLFERDADRLDEYGRHEQKEENYSVIGSRRSIGEQHDGSRRGDRRNGDRGTRRYDRDEGQENDSRKRGRREDDGHSRRRDERDEELGHGRRDDDGRINKRHERDDDPSKRARYDDLPSSDRRRGYRGSEGDERRR